MAALHMGLEETPDHQGHLHTDFNPASPPLICPFIHSNVECLQGAYNVVGEISNM